MHHRNLSETLLIAGSLVLSACRGGSGSSGGAANGAMVITRGAITAHGAGSITVNGVALATPSATVRIEKSERPESELETGMVVTVKGHFDDRTGTATEIEFEDAVKGKVGAKSGDVISVGGHTVRVDDSTEYDDSAARLAGLSVGDRVRVSGVADDRGGLRATRIDSLDDASEDVELKGYVSSLSGTGFTLRVSPDATEYYAVTLAPGATLPARIADGAYVEVRSEGPAVGGAIVAASVSLEDRFDDEASEVEVEGLVTSGNSAEFMVDGQRVRTGASTRWAFGDPADLVPGVKVEAEGRLDAGGVLDAEKVSFRAVVRIRAAASDVALAGVSGTLTLLGIPVSLSSLTDWRISPSAVGNGVVVEVRGYPSRDGAGVVATRIEEESGERIFLTGPVAAEDGAAGTLGILGHTIATDSGTEYHPHASESQLSRSAFFDAVEPGRTVVRARGRDASALSGTTLLAEELELED
jgi:hypothetical protein